VFNRKGLIIDARYNYGGNIDSWILGKLLRQAWFFFGAREMAPAWAMQYAFRGHVVVLCNSRTYSNGETLTEGIRRLGIGKVIGTRTWGGAIWLSGIRTVDNGSLRIPQAGTYGPDGEWLIEGHGIDPDIVVDNLPHATFNGQDAQLEAAIQYLQQQIEENPVEKPVTPPFPDKSFEYNRR
jgi:tricorn protease